MSNQDQEVPPELLDKPLPKGGDFGPMEILPEREWLKAKITDVKMVYAMFKGQVQYVTAKNKDTGEEEFVLDDKGQKKPRLQIVVVYSLIDYQLSNGDPRKGWAHFGASLGDKAILPKYLTKLNGAKLLENGRQPSFNEIKNHLFGLSVWIQFETKTSKDPDKEDAQYVVKEAVKLSAERFILKDRADQSAAKPFPSAVQKAPEVNPFKEFSGKTPAHSPTTNDVIAWDD